MNVATYKLLSRDHEQQSPAKRRNGVVVLASVLATLVTCAIFLLGSGCTRASISHEPAGIVAERLCQPCTTSLDCQTPSAHRLPWEQREPALACRANSCVPEAHVEGFTLTCSRHISSNDIPETYVASRKLLGVGERRLRRARKRGRGAHTEYFGKRSLSNLEGITGHNYLNVHSHDRDND